jgi:hypothetical protein
MEQVLAELLTNLAAVEKEHPELSDTEVEEQTTAAVHDGFLSPTEGYELPEEFGMYSPEGDRAVRAALAAFLPAARAAAEAEGLVTFHQRLAAFQGSAVEVGPDHVCYNDFFRYTDPDRYDAVGNFIQK